jgi:hypothetical protein
MSEFNTQLATGLARCKICNEKIKEGEKEAIFSYNDGNWRKTNHYHLGCISKLLGIGNIIFSEIRDDVFAVVEGTPVTEIPRHIRTEVDTAIDWDSYNNIRSKWTSYPAKEQKASKCERKKKQK